MNEGWLLRCHALAKTYLEGPTPVEVLTNINLAVKTGERIGIIGASGSGKSTLLHLLGGLDLPSSGEVWIGTHNMAKLDTVTRGRLRNRSLGFVYQFHHLLPEFTALENVCMPLLIRGLSPREAEGQARPLLERVDLGSRIHHKPSELSGGERQRAAVARALVTKPQCVLADEPTGNLDYKTANQVYDLMLELNQVFRTTFVVVTHDPRLVQRLDRALILEQGILKEA